MNRRREARFLRLITNNINEYSHETSDRLLLIGGTVKYSTIKHREGIVICIL